MDKLNSKYFTLKELSFSATALKYEIENTPKTAQAIGNLTKLAKCLDTIREFIGSPIQVTCAYRSRELNNKLRSLGYSASNTSYHLTGRAADIYCSAIPYRLFANIILNYGRFLYNESVHHYESSDYEIILYPDRGFIHFAIKK